MFVRRRSEPEWRKQELAVLRFETNARSNGIVKCPVRTGFRATVGLCEVDASICDRTGTAEVLIVLESRHRKENSTHDAQ